MVKSLGRMVIDDRTFFFYEEHVGTVGKKLKLVSVWRSPYNSSRSGFVAEGSSKEALIKYLKRGKWKVRA
jgi:hypothetical protein